jgi:hypothetical protein
LDFSAVVSAGEVCPEEAVSFSPRIVSWVLVKSSLLEKKFTKYIRYRIKRMASERAVEVW